MLPVVYFASFSILLKILHLQDNLCDSWGDNNRAMFHSLKRFKNVVFHAEKSKPTWKLIRNALFLVQKRRFFEGLKKDLEKI